MSIKNQFGDQLRTMDHTYPVQSPAVRKELAKVDICPECGGDLDTGWECLDCNFDAQWLAYPQSERDIDAMP